MGLRQTLREWREWRKMRRAFKKLIPADVIRKLAEDPPALKPPRQQHFEFVIVSIDESNPDATSRVLSDVLGTVFAHDAMVSMISASLVSSYFGVFQPNKVPEARQKLVTQLLRENGNRLRIAHGECDGLVGNFGSEQRLTYDCFIPGFSRILSELLSSEFGKALEIRSGTLQQLK